jgi:hypothetical protein
MMEICIAPSFHMAASSQFLTPAALPRKTLRYPLAKKPVGPQNRFR